MGVKYTTRESVQDALDYNESASRNRMIDDALDAATVSIERTLNRIFYPLTATRYMDWPEFGDINRSSWRLYLDANELISLTTFTSGGTVIPAGLVSGYTLRNFADDGQPPFTYIDVGLDSGYAIAAGTSWQQSQKLVGVFGACADEATAGTLALALSDTTGTAVNINNGAAIGVGDLIRIDTERMLVTARTWLTSAQTLQTTVDASRGTTTIAVTTGSAFSPDEYILIDSERMRITDVAGNNLTVLRAQSGSTLAGHNSTTTIYVSRTLTVQRGAAGTTAATHLVNAPIVRHVAPGLIRQLALAETINGLLQAGAGWARVSGTGDNASALAQPDALAEIRYRAQTSLGRNLRSGAV